ncbi:MAG: GNAT family N-acetyltransferase, partial [Bacteroidetes bacterium]
MCIFSQAKNPLVLVEYYFPQSLSASRLDRYLAGGWFRSGASLFRTRLLCLEGGCFPVVNIRVPLAKYQLSRSLRRNLNRNAPRFRIETGQAQVDPDRERLYAGHKHRFKGFIFDTLEEFLFGGLSRFLFDTWELAVYEGDRLVAVSFFDRGQQSMASLLGLYDRAYERDSLGLFTMLQEIQFAQQIGLSYYYPGYVLQGHPAFDYKLRLGHIQYHNWEGRWRNWDRIGEETLVTEILSHHNDELAQALYSHEVPFKRCTYPFFSLGYLDYAPEQFMRNPFFFHCYPRPGTPTRLAIEYDWETGLY